MLSDSDTKLWDAGTFTTTDCCRITGDAGILRLNLGLGPKLEWDFMLRFLIKASDTSEK